jgi:hypothetical protein
MPKGARQSFCCRAGKYRCGNRPECYLIWAFVSRSMCVDLIALVRFMVGDRKLGANQLAGLGDEVRVYLVDLAALCGRARTRLPAAHPRRS